MSAECEVRKPSPVPFFWSLQSTRGGRQKKRGVLYVITNSSEHSQIQGEWGAQQARPAPSPASRGGSPLELQGQVSN